MNAVLTPPPPSAVPTTPIWRLRVDQYQEMCRLGILTTDDAVELLAGWLVPKMSKNPPHTLAARLLRRALVGLVPPTHSLDTQEPITLAWSEPEPDLFLYRGQATDYPDRHPGPADVPLVVEIADTSLARDRGLKKQLYAEARIPVYWIVNLIDRQVEVYTGPTGAGEQADYAARQDYRPPDAVPAVVGGAEVGSVPVAALLP